MLMLWGHVCLYNDGYPYSSAGLRAGHSPEGASPFNGTTGLKRRGYLLRHPTPDSTLLSYTASLLSLVSGYLLVLSS